MLYWLIIAIVLAIPTIFFMVRIYVLSKKTEKMCQAITAAGHTPSIWENRQELDSEEEEDEELMKPLISALHIAGVQDGRIGGIIVNRTKGYWDEA